jgi:pantoate--beta-alanine ligase
MGALHRGHLEVMDLARREADRLVISIFVNPMQFDRPEDLASYPRTMEDDLTRARDRGVDMVFAPSAGEMYGSTGEASVTVDPGPLADRLEGAHRPGHFRGVLTVVAKLFGILEPDLAFFGQKDLQQSVLVRRMVRELDFPLEVRVAPTVRDEDGLALSSRNALLASDARQAAASLYSALTQAREAFRSGERSVDRLLAIMNRELERHPLVRPEYVQIVGAEDLEPVGDPLGEGAVATLAAFVGAVRLIDNVTLD